MKWFEKTKYRVDANSPCQRLGDADRCLREIRRKSLHCHGQDFPSCYVEDGTTAVAWFKEPVQVDVI